MTYEYKGRGGALGGLGALGWSQNWEVPMSGQTVRNVGCAGGGTLTCARSDEQSFMANQGCVPSVYPENGLDACRTSSGSSGSLFCCPQGRPGTGASTTVSQVPVSRQNIIALQNYIVSQGCSVGSTGADGVYGPNTARGLQCAITNTSYANVAGRFPFITTLMSTPSGQARPASFTFDPGSTAKTPEQVTGGGTGTQAGVTVQPGVEAQPPQRAGFFGSLPWWGWAAIAVGGVAVLGVVGVMAFGDGDEEDDRLSPRRKTAWGDADELSPRWKY